MQLSIYVAIVESKSKRTEWLKSQSVTSALCTLGFNHYRLSTNQLKYAPDIVYPGRKKGIFINGFFWYRHDCPRGALPSSNIEFWEEKITNTISQTQGC